MEGQVLGGCYRLLAFGFAYPDEELAQLLSSGEFQGWLAGAWDALAASGAVSAQGGRDALDFCRLQDASVIKDELRKEYSRLYITPPVLVKCTEGQWRATAAGSQNVPFMINEFSLAVQEFMRRCGIRKRDGYTDALDYVETECSFAGFLAEEPEMPESLGMSALEALSLFANNHLSRWIPGFCRETLEQTISPYYREMSLLLDAVVSASMSLA